MIDEEYLNNLDDVFDDLNDSDKLYEYHFAVEPGWESHRLIVWDAWDVNRWPMIMVKYETPGKEFYLRLNFKEENYKIVTSTSLDLGSGNPIEFNIGPKPLSYFFEVADDGELLPGSEEKCIAVINRFWKLRAFL